jgi:hypothetical protein
VQKLWDWQVVLSYRQLGSDAVLDGFADSDFGLGGTNNKGYTVGALLGIARNSWFGLRYLSSSTIDSPTVQPQLGDKFSVSSWLLDLYVRY